MLRKVELSFEFAAIILIFLAGLLMVAFTIYQFSGYITLQVDLLSFSESTFVNDILKLRMRLPIYNSPLDNESYPYVPGTQILTFALASIFGQGGSIPFYRVIQFFFVIGAAAITASFTDMLVRISGVPPKKYRYRPIWISIFFLFLLLVATDQQFNLYTHSLHNDGLALLISAAAFWLMVRFIHKPSTGLLFTMALLPSLGFLVKQNQLLWMGVFLLFLIAIKLSNTNPELTWRKIVLFVVVSLTLFGVTLGLCYLIWGEYFRYWIFTALGSKTISIFRSIINFFRAGIYTSMALFAVWVLVLKKFNKTILILWLVWLLIFGIQVFTSGIGFQANHMGPGVLFATAWFLVGFVKIWPSAEIVNPLWSERAQQFAAAAIFILLFCGMGFFRKPVNPIPDDFNRYISQIEDEFRDLPADKVLMDTGTWIYARNNVLMKDRSAPVSIHVGSNQPEINHDMLRMTIERIKNKQYQKILARQIDTGETWYDFQDRGSGVKAAILENYHEVNRILEVKGIQEWWPLHLISEIVVLEPNP